MSRRVISVRRTQGSPLIVDDHAQVLARAHGTAADDFAVEKSP
jgi:hypothetical protein